MDNLNQYKFKKSLKNLIALSLWGLNRLNIAACHCQLPRLATAQISRLAETPLYQRVRLLF